MEWLRDSRWREHVVVAARCVESAPLKAFQGQLRQSIGTKRRSPIQSPEPATELLPAAASFGTT
jgi:hypothetical protein